MPELNPNGKPMRALRALHGASPRPIIEQEVWLRARLGEDDTATYHDALNKLVKLGFAERHGRRGGYCYEITAAGIGTVLACATSEGKHD